MCRGTARKNGRKIGVMWMRSTPVKRVNYNVENMRVGKRLTMKNHLDITTDEALIQRSLLDAVEILANHSQCSLSLTRTRKEAVVQEELWKR
jgi:DNA-directed RNA polymerase alpha subunit